MGGSLFHSGAEVSAAGEVGVLQEGDLLRQGGGLGVVLTTTIMGSPDLLVGIWEQWQQQVLLVLRAVWLLNLQQTSLAASLDEVEIVLFKVAKCQINTRHYMAK